MSILILYLIVVGLFLAAIKILPGIILRKANKKRYAHIFEHVDEQKSVAQKTQTEQKSQAGISREQLKRFYESGLISKEEYKAGLKKQ